MRASFKDLFDDTDNVASDLSKNLKPYSAKGISTSANSKAAEAQVFPKRVSGSKPSMPMHATSLIPTEREIASPAANAIHDSEDVDYRSYEPSITDLESFAHAAYVKFGHVVEPELGEVYDFYCCPPRQKTVQGKPNDVAFALISDLAQENRKSLGGQYGKISDGKRNALTAESNIVSDDFVFFTKLEYGRSEAHPTHRVYINASPEHMTEVMKFVVHEILDKDSEKNKRVLTDANKVTSVKCCNSSEVASRRSDPIVVYTADFATAKKVAGSVRELGERNPTYLRAAVPLMTNPYGPGIGIGEEPTPAQRRAAESLLNLKDGQISFGGVRAAIVWRALRESNGDFKKFNKIVADLERKVITNPVDD